jgi:hypothetical protein
VRPAAGTGLAGRKRQTPESHPGGPANHKRHRDEGIVDAQTKKDTPGARRAPPTIRRLAGSGHGPVTLDDLDDPDLTAADVCELCPWAIECTALDGQPCWRRDDLVYMDDPEPEGGDA